MSGSAWHPHTLTVFLQNCTQLCLFCTCIGPEHGNFFWGGGGGGGGRGQAAVVSGHVLLTQHNRDSRRFLVKGSKRIQCMLAVPGVVEVSQDYLETSLIVSKYMEGQRSRHEDDPLFSEGFTPHSKATTLPSESFEEDKTVPNMVFSRTKTSPVVRKELFRQEIRSIGGI